MTLVVKNRRSVPVTSDDMNAVVAHLAARFRGRLFDLRMFFRDGGVVIRGAAASYYVKQLAQHAVMELLELPITANEIVVRSVHRGLVDAPAMTASSKNSENDESVGQCAI